MNMVDKYFEVALSHLLPKGEAAEKRRNILTLCNIIEGYLSNLISGRRAGSEKIRRCIASTLGYEYEEFLSLGRRLLNNEWTDIRIFPSSELENESWGGGIDQPERLEAGKGVDQEALIGQIRSGRLSVIHISSNIFACLPPSVIIFRMTGQSMFPILSDGDMVAADQLEPITLNTLRNMDGRLVAFRQDGETTVRWCRCTDDVMLSVPENPADRLDIQTIPLPDAPKHVIGPVRWWWSGG